MYVVYAWFSTEVLHIWDVSLNEAFTNNRVKQIPLYICSPLAPRVYTGPSDKVLEGQNGTNVLYLHAKFGGIQETKKFICPK